MMAEAKQTPQAIAAMRKFLPCMREMLTSPAVHEGMRIQGKFIDWDAFNEIERACGVPLTPCPDTDVTLRAGK
jgi:hypothetical protein